MPRTPVLLRRSAAAIVALSLVGACTADDDGVGSVGQATSSTTAEAVVDPTVGTAPPSPPAEPQAVADALAACGGGDAVEDPPASQRPASAVGVDDVDVTGGGDPVVPDLGDPRIDVARYDLDLAVDGRRLEARAVLDVALLEDTDELSLDLLGLDVTEVRVDEEPVEARREGAKLVVPVSSSRRDGLVRVSVCYRGEPQPVESEAIEGAAIGWSAASDGSFVLSEPEGARTWFPANDVPTDKAPFEISVSVDEGLVAVANGELVAGPTPCTGEVRATGSEGEDVATDGSAPCPGDVPPAADPAAGRAEYHWRMDAPMAPFLATVLVGAYERSALPSAGGVPIEAWVPPDARRAGRVLTVQTEAVDLLADLLGPYPFASYGGAVLPGRPDDPVLTGVALETQAMVIYAPSTVVDWIVVHETAHQWMGDSVGLESWRDDLWWVEGFATYAEWIWAESGEGFAAYDDAVAEAAATVGGIDGAIGRAAADELFGPLSYQGGALVFHALRRQIGDEDFRTFLQTFVERYRHANAGTDDLIAVAEEVSGQDLTGFFAAWLEPTDADQRPDVER